MFIVGIRTTIFHSTVKEYSFADGSKRSGAHVISAGGVPYFRHWLGAWSIVKLTPIINAGSYDDLTVKTLFTVG